MKVNEKKVNEWWSNLDDRDKEEIFDLIYPDDIIYDLDNEWDKLDWKIKLEVYQENNP